MRRIAGAASSSKPAVFNLGDDSLWAHLSYALFRALNPSFDRYSSNRPGRSAAVLGCNMYLLAQEIRDRLIPHVDRITCHGRCFSSVNILSRTCDTALEILCFTPPSLK